MASTTVYGNGVPKIAGMNGGGCGCSVGDGARGPIPGIGGWDWVAGCGVYRGAWYEIGVSFQDMDSDESGCKAIGISQLCSPSTPRGLWLLPFQEVVPFAAPGDLTKTLTLPRPGRLIALEVSRVTGATIDNVTVRSWRSKQIKQTYPGGGDGTNWAVDGTFDNVLVQAGEYSRFRLLDGQNVLPPWVPNVDLNNGTDLIQCTLHNDAAAIDATVRGFLWVAYGKFDLAAAAQIQKQMRQQAA